MMSKWCVRDSAGGREEEEEEEEKAAGYRTKTRTPHKDVGKNDFSIFLSIVIVFFSILIEKKHPRIETGIGFFNIFGFSIRIEKNQSWD